MTNSVVIQVVNLKKSFARLKAVDGLSFAVHKGEIFGFLGPNGAGKTTTINMICGLSEPDEGEILFPGGTAAPANEGPAEGAAHPADEEAGKGSATPTYERAAGIKAARVGKKELKSRIGICPQENIFWPKLTCLEQLVFMGEMYGMSPKAAKKRSGELLEWMGLTAKANVLASKLSGGMKRRLNLCLALVHDPEILVLDEPEAGLDPQSRILVRDFIKSLKQEKTIILTTHNMDEADRLSDRVAIIDFGKLLLLDTPAQLKRSIGPGDVLEIELEGASLAEDKENLEKAAVSLSKLCDQVKTGGNGFIIKAKNLIESVPGITDKIKKSGFKISKMTMRENTLEDVFIHLTGRKLRQ